MGKNTGKKVSAGVNICIGEDKILFPRGKGSIFGLIYCSMSLPVCIVTLLGLYVVGYLSIGQ
jgi:hypothetical protein